MSSDFITRFNTLLGMASVSSAHAWIDMSNRPVIDYLAQQFADLGFACEVIEVPNAPHKANLIATMGSGPGGLVLSGHTDTVPFDEALWSVNPLAVTEKDNRLYGLGSTDMKGFFAVAYEAVKQFKGSKLQQPLIILATADEESSMDGARSLVKLGRPKARAAIIGEPTGLRPINRHKGIMMERLHVQGESGHSSNPALGRNALEAMHEMITSLLQFRRSLQKKFQNPHFDINVPTLNLGVIHGGDNPNRICGHCALEFDVRLLPGMGSNDMREAISKIILPIADWHKVSYSLTQLFPGVEAFSNEHSELVQVCAALTGYAPQSAAFGTEAPFLQQLGMDTVVLGPGSIDVAHQPDEYMALDQVQPCIDVLTKLISKYCL